MKSLILLFLALPTFIIRGHCQNSCDKHMQVVVNNSFCYGSHTGQIYTVADTGTCAVCQGRLLFISDLQVLDSTGQEMDPGELYAGTYTLIAVMSCNPTDSTHVTIDSINESITITQPPFPDPVFTKIVDTSQSCFGGEFEGYTGSATYIFGTPCAVLDFQDSVNGALSYSSYLTLGDSGFFDIRNLSAGDYRFISGAGYLSRMDTTAWITLDVCGTPSSGFGVKALTSRSAIAVWNPWSCAGRFKVRYKKQNESSWKTTSVINAYTFGAARLTGLEAGTTYQWQVQSLCSHDPDIASAYSALQTFSTLPLQKEDEITATSNYSTEKIMVIPNPASSQISMECPMPEGMATISIYDALGQQVLNTSWNTDEGKTSLDVSKLRSGMFEVIVQNDSYTGTGTFMKQ